MSPGAWVAFTLAYALDGGRTGTGDIAGGFLRVGHGRRTALAVVARTTLGDATCLGAAVFGLGALVAASATAFTVLKLAGAGYLVFLGVRLWRAAPLPQSVPATAAPRSLRSVFVHVYLATALNPKSILFFMVFVPQFMQPQRPLALQFAAMLASVLLCGTLVDGSYSVFAASLRRFTSTARAQRAVAP